ncbi:ACP S-malonyltransferase [Stigmatella sp. ncwal1]|uniref:Malonyl CoA-acyl carrier protein transacylase n=1 Tax=Stigmatella ashevillensis TaxID=2995309 RepID=A0ABT5D1F8_9BACT|nr:ACP S-malonyltransferase [Stigmatella ashevillena]MDC0707421.1 ACP S-malonyltransferase [Stigmatella ashevillena]
MTKIFVFPGQGSQKVGMGAELFREFPQEVAFADAILGYSIEELCLKDSEKRLHRTEFTQPALFVVNALAYLHAVERNGTRPDFAAGHSLGEYNALFAAGAFDFITGLRLVQRRGQLMGRADGGTMAAVVGLSPEQVEQCLRVGGNDEVDIASLNAPEQTVISGAASAFERVEAALTAAGAREVVRLRVSAAFHSRYMKKAEAEFASFLSQFEFSSLDFPVVSNLHAALYAPDQIHACLAGQISKPVRWTETIQLLARQPEPVFEELGPSKLLTPLIKSTVKRTGGV